MSAATLVRYNFRVLIFNNWWLLVFPIAASQLTVFWTLITQKFAPGIPATSAEMVSPIVAAFLAAHILSAEYPSRVGAILASKPLNIGKVVALRLLAVLALTWALELLSLAAFYFGLTPYNVGIVFLASIPSTLFLSLLALTFATLLRRPLAGFGVAALYWALDLPPGPPINPYLSLRSLSTYLTANASVLGAEPLIRYWWVAKILLLVGAVILYVIHARLVFRLGAAATMRSRWRTISAIAALVAVYLVTGAGIKVAYGYTEAGRLDPNDAAWFRKQFASFGPIPVAYLFGAGFRDYLGQVPGTWHLQQEGDTDLLGDTEPHRRALRALLDRAPHSLWAPAAADLLARLSSNGRMPLEQRLAGYRRVVNDYPNSPYVAFALWEEAQTFDALDRQDEARRVFEELLRRRPNSTYRAAAMRYIMQNDRSHGNLAGAENWAQKWLDAAPVQEKFSAWMALADVRKARGNAVGAADAATHARAAVREYRAAKRAGQINGTASEFVRWDRDALDTDARSAAYLPNR